MDHWEQIRKQARLQHVRVRTAASGKVTAQALLEAAAQITSIQAVPVHAGDLLLNGGEAVLDREIGIIWFNADIELDLVRFFIAHEYGHYWLHDVHAICRQTDVDVLTCEAPISASAQLVEGYSPEERREREARVSPSH